MQVNTSYAGYTLLSIGQGIMQIFGKAASVSMDTKCSAYYGEKAHVYAVQCILAVQTGLKSMQV